jgi:hypothetical protein
MLYVRQAQLPGVNFIFQKDKNGNYTKGALLYQDIVRYSIPKIKDNPPDNRSFTHRELAKWLLNNNSEYINYYKDPSTKYYTIDNRIEHTQQRMKDKLNDLINVGLIDVVGSTKVQKGNATTPLCQYNGLAYLLAWLIESFDPNKRERANNEIFNLLDANFKTLASPSSYNKFNAALYKKYKERGVFGSFVVDPLRERLDSNTQTRDIQELFHRIGVLYIDDEDQSEFFQTSGTRP